MAQEKISFTHLKEDIIDTEKCVSCGTCVAICPVNVLEMQDYVPVLVGDCIDCGLCYANCPQIDWNTEEMDEKTFGRQRQEHEKLVGIYNKAYAARTTSEAIMKHAQDGGVVTSLLIQFLANGGDGVVVASLDEEIPWAPRPIVAKTAEEIRASSGTKYTPSPTLLGVKEAVKEQKLEKIAVVGTSCQMRGLTRATIGSKRNVRYQRAVDLKIGLFCMETFTFTSFMEYLNDNDIDPKTVTKFEIKRGRFYVHMKEGKPFRVKLAKIKDLVRPCCHMCDDFTSEFADISVGNVGSPRRWSTVIVRTQRGEQALQSTIDSGLIEVTPIEGFDQGETLVHRLSKTKKEQALHQ